MERGALIILYSYHHNNTEKIAKAITEILDVRIVSPQQVNIDEIEKYNLIGFASGIYDGKHHKSIVDFVDKMPNANNKKVFIFSTCGMPNAFLTENVIKENHSAIKEKLQSKGYKIIGEFGCAGFNTNSFLKIFGGINKGRPNERDVEQAKEFAHTIKSSFNG